MSSLVGGIGIIGQDMVCGFGNGKYTQFEGTEIVAENCVRAKVKDLVVEGKTYQNLVSNLDELVGNIYTKKNEAKVVSNLLKVSTTYTFIINISEANYSDTNFGAIMIINYPTLSTSYVNISKKNGIFKVRYTIKEEIPRSILISPHANNDTTSSFKLENLIILEGDYTNIDLPNSINGIESMAEREENLVNTATIYESMLESGVVDSLFNPKSSSTYDVYKMEIQPNTEYLFNLVGYGQAPWVRILDKNNIIVKSQNLSSSGLSYIWSLKTEDNFYYLVFNKPKTSTGTFQIYKMENPYPLKLKINEENNYINLPIPLRSLPNGVADTIEGDKLVQRVGKVMFDGHENWILQSCNVEGNGILNIFFIIQDLKLKGKQFIICDKYIQQNTTIANTTKEGVLVNEEKRLYLRLFTSKATTVEEAKEYIKDNPFVVYYELATPIIHNLEIPSISTTKGTNVITTTNNIKPNLKMKVKVKK